MTPRGAREFHRGPAACLGDLLLAGCGHASPVHVRVAVSGVPHGAGFEDLACGRCVPDGGLVVEAEDGGEVKWIRSIGEGLVELAVHAEPFEGSRLAAQRLGGQTTFRTATRGDGLAEGGEVGAFSDLLLSAREDRRDSPLSGQVDARGGAARRRSRRAGILGDRLWAAVGEVLARTVTLTPEGSVAHHDEGPVSLITTAALRRLAELTGGEPDSMDIDPLRFRANLLIDLPGSGSPEENWPGNLLRVGPDVVLRPVRQLTRCAMIDMAQDQAGQRNDLLKALAEHHDLTFGVFATVEQQGRVAVGDVCSWA